MALYNLLENMINKIKNNASNIDAQSAELIYLKALINNINNTIYPIGSIYMSVDSTSPAALFGGTWEKIENRFLFSASDTILAGTLAGEAEHTLTTSEMPKHKHAASATLINTDTNNTYEFQLIRDLSAKSTARVSVAKGTDYSVLGVNPTAADYTDASELQGVKNTAETGEGLPHNNMPPYLAVYTWKRIA